MSEELKFEKAMEKLAKIVEDLESGEMTLEDALKKYEEGVKLSGACQDQLSKAEKKIEILRQDKEGMVVPSYEGEKESGLKPAIHNKQKKVEEGEDNLLF